MNAKIILDDVKNMCEKINFNRFKDTTVLLTGASGLIGTYFLAFFRRLKQNGFRMQVYAQIFSDQSPHMLELMRDSGFKIIKADLANSDEYSQFPMADMIIHAAGYAQPIRFMDNPVATFQINTSATIALLKHLLPNGSFLFLSSGEVYCGLKDSFFRETDIGTTNPFHPRASYIEGKRGGEAICNAFRSQGMHATAVRLGDVYGPGTRKHDKRALNSFIEKALCHHKIDLLDAGTAIRTYCYISDAVELLLEILLRSKETVYNVGGKSTLTIAELAKMIAEMTNAAVVFPTTQAEITGAPEQVCLDITKVETEFGKTDYVSMENGLRTTIEWQRDLYGQ